MLRVSQGRGRHRASARWGVLHGLAVVLSGIFVILGVLVVIGPTDDDPSPAPEPLPDPTHTAPAVVVTPGTSTH